MKTVLGRGLASLIPREPAPPPPASQAPPEARPGVDIIARIDIDSIQRNPYQPRADFDQAALDELTRSIRDKGIIQPITVRRHGDGYQLISGERRVRAARDAGLRQIPAYIIEVRADEEMLELALIENLQREHLNPVEIGISYRRLIEECNYTQEEVAQRIGKDRTTITNALRLLKLPALIQTGLRKGELTSGHARALVAVEDESLQLALYHRIVRDDLSVRAVERLVRVKTTVRRKRPAQVATVSDIALSSVEDRLRRALGTKVQVRPLEHGKGEILIEYYSADDLERLLELLDTAHSL